jgi:hypothetical protein
MKLLLDDCNEQMGGNGAPPLRRYRVLAGAEKLLEVQVRLAPIEKQLHRPAVLVVERELLSMMR